MTNYSHITTDAVEAEVRRVAAERPDFVYTGGDFAYTGGKGCYYVHDADTGRGIGNVGRYLGQRLVPGCIIGVALANLGVELPDLAISCTVLTLLPNLGIPSSPWLNRVQAQQDAGRTWGEAVALADAGRYRP